MHHGQGRAESAHIDALEALDRSAATLIAMARAGHPGAVSAYRHNRRAYRHTVEGNRALNQSNRAA